MTIQYHASASDSFPSDPDHLFFDKDGNFVQRVIDDFKPGFCLRLETNPDYPGLTVYFVSQNETETTQLFDNCAHSKAHFIQVTDPEQQDKTNLRVTKMWDRNNNEMPGQLLKYLNWFLDNAAELCDAPGKNTINNANALIAVIKDSFNIPPQTVLGVVYPGASVQKLEQVQ